MPFVINRATRLSFQGNDSSSTKTAKVLDVLRFVPEFQCLHFALEGKSPKLKQILSRLSKQTPRTLLPSNEGISTPKAILQLALNVPPFPTEFFRLN